MESVYKCKRQSEGYLEMLRLVCTSNCSDAPARKVVLNQGRDAIVYEDSENAARSCNYCTWIYQRNCCERGALLEVGFWTDPVPAVFLPMCSSRRCLRSSQSSSGILPLPLAQEPCGVVPLFSLAEAPHTAGIGRCT